jgi:hypothetical protein
MSEDDKSRKVFLTEGYKAPKARPTLMSETKGYKAPTALKVGGKPPSSGSVVKPKKDT